MSFGATGGEVAVKFCAPQPQDMNGDALPDLVCHFSTRECGFEIEDKEGIITGRTLDGIPLVGSDSVRIVGSQFSNTSGGHRAYHF